MEALTRRDPDGGPDPADGHDVEDFLAAYDLLVQAVRRARGAIQQTRDDA